MSYEDPNLADLVEQAKAISNNLAEGDRKTNARFAQLEESINTVFKKLGRVRQPTPKRRRKRMAPRASLRANNSKAR